VLEEIRRLTAEAKKAVDSHGGRSRLPDFCPGAALMNTGSPIRIHPAALKRMEIRASLRTNESE
jgi:hypothetical protein